MEFKLYRTTLINTDKMVGCHMQSEKIFITALTASRFLKLK